MSLPCPELKITKQSRQISSPGDDSPDDRGDPLDLVEIHAGFAWQLNQIRPNSLRIWQSIPDTIREPTEQVNRHVAALNCIAAVAKRADHARSQIHTAPSRQHANDLREARRAWPVRYELQSVIAAKKPLISANARAARADVFIQRIGQTRRHCRVKIRQRFTVIGLWRCVGIGTARMNSCQGRRPASPAMPNQRR